MRPHRSLPPRHVARLGLAAGAIALLLAACAGERPGWTFAPVPSATPVPSASPAESAASSASPSVGVPSASASSPVAGGLEITAMNIAYDTDALTATAGEPFSLVFHNEDAGVPHNVAIHADSPTGPEVWKGDIFPGVETRTYEVPALEAGTYGFVCTVHPNMTGTLTVE